MPPVKMRGDGRMAKDPKKTLFRLLSYLKHYVGVLAIPPDEWEITNVAVDPDFRRQGMGEALMRALADKAAQAGVARISLEVRVSNGAAIGLYRKLGFVDCGVRKNFYSAPREDGVIMEKLF